jgi:hypothetical protein
MKCRYASQLKWFFWIVAAAGLFCGNAQAQYTLSPGSLSCTRYSLALGFATLPACYESKAETLDRVNFYVSAYCVACAGGYETLPNITLTLNIGQQNGPCTNPVAWQLSGGTAGSGSAAYIYGNLQAQSDVAFARISGSEDCNGVPAYSGDNGSRLDCH